MTPTIYKPTPYSNSYLTNTHVADILGKSGRTLTGKNFLERDFRRFRENLAPLPDKTRAGFAANSTTH